MKDVKSLEKKDINKASEVLAKAFENDEFVKYILEGKKDKYEKLFIMFKTAVKFGLFYGEIYVTEDLKGVTIWYPPDKYVRPTWRWIRSGAIKMIRKVGFDFLKREKPVTDFRDEIRYKLMKVPHSYWYAMGIDPDYQGNGYGSLLFKKVLKRSGNFPIYGDCNTEKNNAIWEHYGFKIIEKNILPTPPRKDIYNWSVVRYP